MPRTFFVSFHGVTSLVFSYVSFHGVIAVVVVVVVLHQPHLVRLQVGPPVLPPGVEGKPHPAEEDHQQEEGHHAGLGGEDGT